MNEKKSAEVIDFATEAAERAERRSGISARQAIGGNPPTGPRGDWLAEMEEFSRFLARSKLVGGSELKDFFIATKMPGFCLLAFSIKGRDTIFEWHDTQQFSKDWKHYATLGVMNADDTQVQPRGMEGNASVEEQPPLHEE